MEAHSMDVRERIVSACDEGLETRDEVTERFDVSTSFIRKLLQRRRVKPCYQGIKMPNQTAVTITPGT